MANQKFAPTFLELISPTRRDPTAQASAGGKLASRPRTPYPTDHNRKNTREKPGLQ